MRKALHFTLDKPQFSFTLPMRKTINDFCFHSILIDVAPVDDAILFEHDFAQRKVNATILHISTCCFAIMLICGLFFQLLSAFIQNPHEH